jgi:DNA-binding NarL/FixJ family response regulator
MTRILLGDHNELSRLAIRSLLNAQADIELIGEACSFQELLYLSHQLKPDLILLELCLSDGDVTSKMTDLLESSPLVLVLTACKERVAHLLALRSGSIGIITKDQSLEMILKAIRSVSAGEAWIDRSIAQELCYNFSHPEAFSSSVEISDTSLRAKRVNLSSREIEIARLASHGLSSKKIASVLFISDKTVRNQLAVIYSKLDIANQLELVFHATELGLK